MIVDQILQQEIKDTEVYLNREHEESVYKRDLKKRIELINSVLENMKKPETEICSLIESRMNEIILTINKIYSIFESDKLHSKLRILDWIFYQVCIPLIYCYRSSFRFFLWLIFF
jgi:hypothetical protein